MPGTFYMPVSAPVEAVRPRTDSTSEASTTKTDSGNPGFDKILDYKTKEEVRKSEGVEESSNDKSRRSRTRAIKAQDHIEPEKQPSAMESTLSKVFGENRDLATQTATESGQSMNGDQTASGSDGKSVIFNPIAIDTYMPNSGRGMISNSVGTIDLNAKIVEGIGPPGAANSPPLDSTRIETAGPRGNDQNPQTEKPRFTEEAEASKAQREVSVKTTPVFDWVRRNFKTPAGEITRGNTDRLTMPDMQDSKPVVTGPSSDSKQPLADAMQNSQPVIRATSDSFVQPSTDFQREIKPVADTIRVATDRSPELVSQNVKVAETVGRNVKQSSVNTFSDSKPEFEIIQSSITDSTKPVSSDPVNRESMQVDTDKVPKVVAQDIKPTDEVPRTAQQETISGKEVPRVVQQETLSGKEVPRVEAEQPSKPSVQNEPVTKQEISSGDTVRETKGNSDTVKAPSESGSTSNPEQKVFNAGVKVVDSYTQKGVTPQSENATSPVSPITSTLNPSTVPVNTPAQSLIDIKVDEPVSVLGNAPVRIATEIKESAVDELPLGGKAVLKIELSPPRLGRMNIELVKMEGGIDVKMIVRTAFARDLLIQRGEEIKTALHDQGIDVKRFSIVETGNLRDNTQQNMSGFHSNTSSHQNDGHFRESQETADYSLQIPVEESEDGSIIDSVSTLSNRDNSGRVNILA